MKFPWFGPTFLEKKIAWRPHSYPISTVHPHLIIHSTIMRSLYTLLLSGVECLTGTFSYNGAETVFYREENPESFDVKKANCEAVGGRLAKSKNWF